MGSRNDNQADGRWTPVINNHTRHGGISRNQPLVTIFVDNLPDNTSQPWLKKMFNNYGVVKDVFIPQKRSKVTGNKFGFIRYDCPVSADLAVLKANGLWLDDKKLFVKIASFSAKGGLKQAKIDKPADNTCQGGVNGSGSHNNEVLVNNGRSFTQVLIGKKTPIGIDNLPKADVKTINLQPVGNGWLFRSAVATLCRASQIGIKIFNQTLAMNANP
ncbi:hypothetical protein Vadar_003888 [Vaccinium darrowii]|uniref:Uncharacterized protein n=1 Tax=Vaccinium darrowii TaxID=229202 RepID=A0ACB7X7F8_9ERIC|nr:hypothetical protein Vadar_003888 [Vaccinium darrowii]